MNIQQIDQFNRGRIDEFILQQWFSMQMVVRGESIDLSTVAGYYAVEGDGIIGLITYRITDNEMEILSLDSIHENKGIGTELLNKAIFRAVEMGCAKITLITTNDNLLALRFYQKRGFDMEPLKKVCKKSANCDKIELRQHRIYPIFQNEIYKNSRQERREHRLVYKFNHKGALNQTDSVFLSARYRFANVNMI